MPSNDSGPHAPRDRSSDGGPASDVDSAAFVGVDWSDRSPRRFRPDARTAGLLVALAALAALFAYDYVVAPEELVAVLDWDVSRVDWLFVLSVVLLVRYGIAPLVLDRERAARHLRTFAGHPAGVVSLLYIVAFALVGVVGTDPFFSLEYPRLKYRYQPPVFAKFPVEQVSFYECRGAVRNGYCHGTWQYPLGTTHLGENVLRLIMDGMRIALQLGLTAGMMMAVIATAVGTVAGYYGGVVDDALMGYVDIQQTVPAIVVYLILSTMFLGQHTGVTDGQMLSLILVFGLLDWGGIARLVRSEVLARREKGYVRAARAAGASNAHVVRRHVVPNSKTTIVTSLTRRIPLLILAQVALVYLGVNRIESESLGRLLRYAHLEGDLVWQEMWWVSVFPVLFLVGLVVAFNVLGDAIRDVYDPQEEVK